MNQPNSYFVEALIDEMKQIIREIKAVDPDAMLKVYLAVSSEFNYEDMPHAKAG